MAKDREPGVLQFMGLQRVRHILATEQQQQQIPCHRRKVQRRPVMCPGPHRSLVPGSTTRHLSQKGGSNPSDRRWLNG